MKSVIWSRSYWQVSLQLGYGDTCQIWIWYKTYNINKTNTRNVFKGEINNDCSVSTPTPSLTHLPLVPQICISESGQQCFRYRLVAYSSPSPLQWCHNEHDGISNHQPHHCLLNRLFRRRSKKTSKLHVTGLCAGNSPKTSEFPAQRASNAEKVSIWWRHHDYLNQHWITVN